MVQALPWSPAGVVSTLLEQWGVHIPKMDRGEALRKLGSFATEENSSLVAIIESQPYRSFISSIVMHLMKRPKNMPHAARIIILLTPGGHRPRLVKGVPVWKMNPESFSQNDIEIHLRQNRGFDDAESTLIYSRIASLGFSNKPGKVYTYIDQHCAVKNGSL